MHGPKLIEDNRWMYTEKLPCGGVLQVFADTWQIEYAKAVGYPSQMFFTHIDANRLNDYYQAWIKNYGSYEKMMESVPNGSHVVIPGELGMVIRIGTECDGVSLFHSLFRVNTRAGLRVYLESYQYASKRAFKVMKSLQALEPLTLPE